MTSALENTALIEYFQYLQRSYSGGSIPIKRDVFSPGFRKDDDICILNADIFISSSDGELIDPSTTKYVWLCRELLLDTKTCSTHIYAPITYPLSPAVLVDFFQVLVKISKHNLIPTLLLIAGGMVAFHFQTVVEMYGNCPITVAIGPSQSGKSTAIKAALSLFTCDEIGLFVKGTNAVLLD